MSTRRISIGDSERDMLGLSQEARSTTTYVYQAGAGSLLDVLDAQRALYISQAELARSQSQVTLDLVALYKALGGGWESKEK